jgi:hypothetical protein
MYQLWLNPLRHHLCHHHHLLLLLLCVLIRAVKVGSFAAMTVWMALSRGLLLAWLMHKLILLLSLDIIRLL